MFLSTHLEENIAQFKKLLPIGKSFDLVTRELYLGNTPAYFITINGMCRTEVLQQIFSDLQNPLYMQDTTVTQIQNYLAAKIGYAQVELSTDMDKILQQLLSGPSVLLIDGFAQAILIDARSYQTRSVEEPDTEHVTKGARDGFVETMLFNTNLIRRRIRSPRLTFELLSVGTDSRTDISLAYLGDLVDCDLLDRLRHALKNLQVTSLTMGSKSLEELLIPKHWYHPMPGIHNTERPDVASSYLMEGHILIIVDNSPSVLILPCSLFQFTQSSADYYRNPLTGGYFRLVRFLCIPISLFLLPAFYLVAAYYPDFAVKYRLLSDRETGWLELTIFVFAAEFLLDLFRYSCAHSASRFSGSLSIIGGLIIGDIAVQLQWATVEVLFYAAITLLTTLSLASIDLGDALRLYRMFLLIATVIFGIWGFAIASILIILSLATTPTFGGMSYLWPLFPFHWGALKTLLFRYPTFKAQPSKVWPRK
ncbi:MAG: spore germination protein [Lachnospiraceae bacterium]|nr:spore germination protein [Lachnospiraceae bacterium]